MRLDRLESEPAVAIVRGALAGKRGWIVGGTVRDCLLERPLRDVDLAIDGDPKQSAGAIAAAAGGPAFPLSDAFGTWRALSGDGDWFCDLSPLQGSSIEQDLAARDFTVNAMAVPLEGGELIDVAGGLGDLERGLLRVVGPQAYSADPLRPLRLARLSAELGLDIEPETEALTRVAAPGVVQASGERIFGELRRLVCCERALDGLRLADRVGLTAAVLPELAALHGVEQSDFHHLDVYDHTLSVLERQIELERGLDSVFDESAGPLGELLAAPLADELTCAEALRFGALVHDIGKPATRGVRADGRVTFIGHDRAGQALVGELCGRLRTSERLRAFLAALARHHLALGFLVHERPLSRNAVYGYLARCSPVEVEVTVLSCADRLATRGRNAEPAIAAHLGLARDLIADALDWRLAGGAPKPPLRGDDLAAALDIERGPELGMLLARLREARYTGEIETREDAIAFARALRENAPR